MVIKQLSVFLENKPGYLLCAADSLAKNGVNIRALSLADTAEFGILRLIADRPEEGRRVLSDLGLVVRLTDVLAVSMDDTPGGMLTVLSCLGEAGINVEYMYASSGSGRRAVMSLQTSDTARADAILREHGMAEPSPEDLA